MMSQLTKTTTTTTPAATTTTSTSKTTSVVKEEKEEFPGFPATPSTKHTGLRTMDEQAPNRATTWSKSQQPRSVAMSGIFSHSQEMIKYKKCLLLTLLYVM
jgi:hypothetical protein